MGCVPRRAAGVRGPTSVSPVDISSGPAPALSPATFLKGECHCLTNVFCGLYNRGTMLTVSHTPLFVPDHKLTKTRDDFL